MVAHQTSLPTSESVIVNLITAIIMIIILCCILAVIKNNGRLISGFINELGCAFIGI